MIELKNICKHYNPPGKVTKKEILKGIDLTLKQGESIAIVGPSGSGKSTLLNIMGTLDNPSQGMIKLEGIGLAQKNVKELANIRNKKIGFIFQMHHLLPQLTVKENVLIPTLAGETTSENNKSESLAIRLLERVGLANHQNHRPGQLSGGECQRVAVVRALINQPIYLLADEPTGSLDAQSADNLSKLLLDLNKETNVALIVVTHSMRLANKMNKVYELNNGKLKLSIQ